MKNIKRYFTLFLAASLTATAMTGCDNGLEEFSKETPMTPPSDKFNAKIQFVSRLTDAPLATTDAEYTAIDNYMVNTLGGKTNSWLTVLDRADGANLSKLMTTALNTKRWTAFAANRIVQKTNFQGSMFFANKWMTEVSGTPCGKECQVTGISTKMVGTKNTKNAAGEITATSSVSFDIRFETARFETADQLTAFGGKDGVLKALYQKKANFLMIGTVKKELFGALQNATQNVANHAFTVEKITEGSAYTLFMLAEERFWGFTDVTSVSLGNGVNAYTVNVMW